MTPVRDNWLRRLARADPDAIATAGRALAAPTTVSIDLDDVAHPRLVLTGRAGQLLVATERGGRYSGCRVFELPGGTLVERQRLPGHLAPGGRGAPRRRLTARRPKGRTARASWSRYSDGRPHVLHRSPGPMTVAPYPGASHPGASHPGGFVSSTGKGRDGGSGSATQAGAALREVPLDYPPSPPEDIRGAVDAGSGRLGG